MPNKASTHAVTRAVRMARNLIQKEKKFPMEAYKAAAQVHHVSVSSVRNALYRLKKRVMKLVKRRKKVSRPLFRLFLVMNGKKPGPSIFTNRADAIRAVFNLLKKGKELHEIKMREVAVR